MKPDYDLFIIGGGINGAGIARDAAGRSLSVFLAEKGDLAGATSSASSKLIHGGLRYLEYYEFRLVREALKEREVLLGLAPHNISPLEFVLPHDETLRPAWMIRLGLFLYDHLAGRHKLHHSRGLNLARDPRGTPLQDKYRKGFSYADCWADDARLVVLNAMDAAERGAVIMPRTACIGLTPRDGVWQVTLRDEETKAERVITAAKIVNAAGPWVHEVLENFGLADTGTPSVRLVKGSHIIVPRLYEGGHAYILQQPDRRIVFVIPYHDHFTLIGTTDVEYHGDPGKVEISPEETAYLCKAVDRFLKTPVTPEMIVSSYSGVRPLFDDGENNAAAVTRDYRLILDHRHGPQILSVFGGKITTYRELAAHAVNDLCGGKEWTHEAVLPGGDIPDGDIDAFIRAQAARRPGFPPALIRRWCHLYGTRMERFLRDARSVSDLGRDYGGGLYEAEIHYLVGAEWARTADDILWRRTKLGLFTDQKTRVSLETSLPRILREEKTA